jgi:hypothetical protein
MSDVNPRRSEIERRMDEFDLARRALKWILEHRVYWDRRFEGLMEPVSLAGRQPFTQPPDEVMIFILALVREVDLEAESAS